MRLELHHVEILLCNQVSFHAETEFIAARSGKDQRGDVNSKIGNLEAIGDDDVGKGSPTHELLDVQIHQIDVEMVCTFCIGEAEVQSHLLMLKRKCDRLKMSEQTDQAFLLGQAVFDHLIANEKGLDARLYDIYHGSIVRHFDGLSKGLCLGRHVRDIDQESSAQG